jgi:hypothetical protein
MTAWGYKAIPIRFAIGIVRLTNSGSLRSRKDSYCYGMTCYVNDCLGIQSYPDTLRYRDCSTNKFRERSEPEFESHEKKKAVNG